MIVTQAAAERPCATRLGRRRLTSARPTSSLRAGRSGVRCAATRPPAVVILPGLGNATGDYDALKSDLEALQLTAKVANVARIDWARNAAGVVDINYWKGTLCPTPTVNW